MQETFRNLGFLKFLDLSYNKLTVLTTNTLSGLHKLERLKINNNQIKTIELGAFDHLPSIKRIDVGDNPLICDCNIAWMLAWLDVVGTKAMCGSPPSLGNTMIKKLKTNDLTCDVPMIPTLGVEKYNKAVIDMKITPERPQISFEGDSLKLVCHVGLLTNDLLVRWFHNGKLLSHSDSVSITNLPPSQHQSRPGHQSHLSVSRLEERHEGNWTCSALVDTGLVQNTSVNVAVISSSVVLCPSTTTNTSKGLYHWGVTVAGHAALQKCHNSSRSGQAWLEHFCDETGAWAILNDTACGHISEVTDNLYTFAYMNDSDFDKNTLIQSARQLLEFTEDFGKFRDGMDIVYLSTVLENYLPYLTASSHELAGLLVDIVANTMKMSPDIIYQGQLLGHAASRLIASIANISRIIVPAFQHQHSSVSVEARQVSPSTFAGISCNWYSEPGRQRIFYCSENKESLGKKATVIGRVQVPSTLYYQLKQLDRDVNIAKNLMFSVFSVPSLFPQVLSAEPEQIVVSSCVLGSTMVAVEPFNLSQPVYVMLRLEPRYRGLTVVPAVWDSRANSGLGAWQPHHCTIMTVRPASAVFSCHRLGHYALLADREQLATTEKGITDHRTTLDTAVYVCSILSIVVLCITICVFTYLYGRIKVTKKLKHALPNFWMSLIFLLVFYCLSTLVQAAPPLCQTVGVLLHYFTLTTFLWMALVSSLIYRKLVNPTDLTVSHNINPYVVTPQEEVYVGDQKKYRKPVGQYYLIGWGVPMIICGITAGASLSQYSASPQLNYSWCALSLAPAAGAILVPLVIIVVIQMFFVFAIFSFSPGSSKNVVVRSQSQSSLVVSDCQHSSSSHSWTLLGLALLLVSACTAATLRVLTPLPAWLLSTSSQHLLFSLLYCVLILLLSGLILVYYCLLRQDVVHCRIPLGWGERGQDETSNLVDLTAKPVMLETKAGYPMLELGGGGGSVLGPSTGPRLKQCNLERESEASSDYHSVNNSQHLSRPRPGGLSESEINRSMTDIIFGPSAKVKVNNVNIHMADSSSIQKQSYYHPSPAVLSPGYQPSSPLELPYPDISDIKFLDKPRQSPVSVSASMPRRKVTPEKKRAVAHSDVERVEIYSSSRISEISSSTCASLRSRQSKTR